MKKIIIFIFAACVLSACHSLSPAPDIPQPDPPSGNQKEPVLNPPPEEEFHFAENIIQFTAIGEELAGNLIDLEFLPGGAGSAVAAARSGELFFLNSDFEVLGVNQDDLRPFVFDDGNERGVLNILPDPDFAENHFLFVFYSAKSPAISEPDGRVDLLDRFTVAEVAGEIQLVDRVTILKVDRSQLNDPNQFHHGGGMFFLASGELILTLGDGGITYGIQSQPSQNPDHLLGKIHRFVPSRAAGVGGFDPGFTGNGISTIAPTVYALGFRNPFTAVGGPGGTIWVGDVGHDDYEEIDRVAAAGENFGWPLHEGPGSPSPFLDPHHGFSHEDDRFENEDPALHGQADLKFHAGVSHPDGNKAIIVLGFYAGEQYEGRLTDRLFYTDFYSGWIRALQLDEAGEVLSDSHMGHQSGLTGLKENPANGLLYGVSLFGSSRILRLDLLSP